jgi:glycosyltransferase involved in cell wall biosynthesis
VILTSYNHAKYLREAIESILNQTFTDFDLIIGDDASTDESWDIIQSYTDPRIIHTYRHKNNRESDIIGETVLSSLASNDYIAIHHSDDVWEPQKLEKQVSFLDQHPNVGAVFTWAQIIDEHGLFFTDERHFYYKIFDQPNRTRYEWLNHFFYRGNALCHPSVLIRKTCYAECGLYRYGFAQLGDFDMWVRLCLKYEIHVIPEKLVRFRVRSSDLNTSGDRQDTQIRGQFEFLQLLENYRNIPSIQELIKVFPNAEKYLKPQGHDLGFALGMVALESETYQSTELFGLNILFEILSDSGRAKKIKELYDFTYLDLIKETGKHDVFGSFPPGRLQKAAIFADCGDGFKADISENKFSYFPMSGNFIHQFDLASLRQKGNGDIQALRFDPHEGYFVKCVLQSVEMDGKPCNFIAHNSARRDADFDVFLTPDPIYILEGDFSGNTLTICGNLHVLDGNESGMLIAEILGEKESALIETQTQLGETKTQLGETKTQLGETKTQLGEIINSRAWKVSLLLRRILARIAPPNSLHAILVLQLAKAIAFPFKKNGRNRRLKEELTLVRSSGLFDENWYLIKNTDVADAKLDPLRHFLLFGGFERRDPNPQFNSGWYLDTYEDVKRAGSNPFVHYLESGRREGRLAKPDEQFQISNEFQLSSGIIEISQNTKANEIAVILHLFYEDLFEEIKEYLQNLPDFDLYISMPRSLRGFTDHVFSSFPNAKIYFTENRGRDILPFISIYRNICLLNYKYLLKIHTKKSPHREDGDAWRADVYGKLLGSPEIISSVMLAFETNQAIGVIGPKGHVIDYRVYWGNNKKKTEELAQRVKICLKDNKSFNFVAGSMFWAKPDALRYLSLLWIEPQEYESEPLGPDGALVHALERFLGLTVEEAGYSIYEVDDQANVSDPQKNSSNDLYPFGMADGTPIVSEENPLRIQNSHINSINRLMRFIRNVRLLGKLIYKNRRKVVGIGIGLIRNPRDLKITQKIAQSVRGIAQSNSLNPNSKEMEDVNSLVISEKVALTEHLAEKLLKCLANKQYVISVSHSEYMQVVGGVEIMIMDEQKSYNKNDAIYLHIYPFLMPNPRLVSENESLYIGINCNGERIGVTDREGLLSAFSQLNPAGLLNIIIHHTMGFDLVLIGLLLKEFGNHKGRFWLHDNFSICPGYTLLRNDLSYCGAPDVNSNACLICKHGKTRTIQQPAFIKLFNDNDFEIVSPSRFALDIWKEKFPFARISEKVAPHVNLNWKGTLPSHQSKDPIRIGFLGYPVYWKGWETWMRLVTKFYNDPRYQFYCFTSWHKSSSKMKWISVSVSKNDRLSMVKALRDNKIDVAFLWSLCPETFSFTLHESLAAGCYVLTYKDSGNIQAYLNQNKNRGLVLNDEQALFELLSGDDLNSMVTDYQKNGRPQAEFSFLPDFD